MSTHSPPPGVATEKPEVALPLTRRSCNFRSSLTVIGLGGLSRFSHRALRQQTSFPRPSAEGGASKEILRDDWLPGVGNVVMGVGLRTPGNDWLFRDPVISTLERLRR